MKSPEVLLSSGDCKAQVLSVSDQHAIVLLETPHQSGDKTPVKSLLKLTVQTFHKKFLEKSDYNNNSEDTAATTPEISYSVWGRKHCRGASNTARWAKRFDEHADANGEFR